MKHISILVPERAVLASIGDPRYMFTAVNDFLAAQGRNAMFEVQLVGLTKEVKLHDGLFTVNADKTIGEVQRTDLIFVPALSGDMATGLEMNRAYIPWIIDQYQKGAEVVSLCIGAFLLASTGLLNGRNCSTHWLSANQFREMFPEVNLVDQSIITEQNGLYSSGGANSYWNLLLHLVEKYTDREMAIWAAKFFAIEISRQSQAEFMVFKGQKGHADDVVKKAQEYIEMHFADKITVDQLSDIFGIGRRSLERRFKKATSNTITEYSQRVKIESAKKQLESGARNVSEVMYEVGYTDAKAFRDLFRRITGISPLDYRQRYRRTAMA